MAVTTVTLKPRAPFDFISTVQAHGWLQLAPFQWDNTRQILSRVEKLPGGHAVLLSITSNHNIISPRITIRIEHYHPLSQPDEKQIIKNVTYMLRADENLQSFYDLCARHDGHWSTLPAGAGRLLRSSTLFEDIVKTICTTNIQWSGTRRMIAGLAEHFGTPFPGNPALKSFPAAEDILAVSFEDFCKKINLGYRALYVYELAQKFANKEIKPDTLLDPALETATLKKQLLAIKGIGPYAAATLLMLLGRYDELPVDSVFREFVEKKYFNGKPFDVQQAKALYRDWGKWQYLAYWFDLYAYEG